jgi:hypothetical protein
VSLKDKLEIGLKPDAPYRPDNLPEAQQDDPACQVAGTPGESDAVENARDACDTGAGATPPAEPPKPKPAKKP